MLQIAHSPPPAPAVDHAPRTWGSLLFRLAVFLLLMVVCDHASGRLLDRLLPRVRTGERIGAVNATLEARADVLILGSSRALHSYDDARLSSLLGARVRNAGMDGRGLLYARAVLALCIQAHAPSLVVLDVAWVDDERDKAATLAPFYGRSPTVDAILVGGDWRRRLALESRAYRWSGAVLPLLANLGQAPPAWGWKPLARALDPVAAPALPEHVPVALPLPAFFEETAEGLVRDARSVGAKVVFVESPTYRYRYAPEVLAVYQRVAERLAVPFFHAAATDEPRFAHPDLYFDAGHLNQQGAAVFTPWIAERL